MSSAVDAERSFGRLACLPEQISAGSVDPYPQRPQAYPRGIYGPKAFRIRLGAGKTGPEPLDPPLGGEALTGVLSPRLAGKPQPVAPPIWRGDVDLGSGVAAVGLHSVIERREARIRLVGRADLMPVDPEKDVDPIRFREAYYLVPQAEGEAVFREFVRVLAEGELVAVAAIAIRDATAVRRRRGSAPTGRTR